MSDLALGFTGVAAALVLMAMRLPIAIALGLVSLVGIWLLRGTRATLALAGTVPFEFSASWTLSAVPMFLLLGGVAFHTGLTNSLYSAARLWLAWLPGGLAVATNFAAAGFAAASGSAMATAAAIGRLAVPEMLRYGYDKALATATVAAAGTLGALIPPSIGFVIYGWFTSQPIGKLLIAGIIPGLLTAAAFSTMIMLRAWRNPALAPAPDIEVTWAERRRALIEVWPMPLLIFGVIGSIYGGVATPTEAGALGATLAVIISMFRGEISFSKYTRSVVDTLKTTASIFFIVVGAVLLTRFLGMSGVPRYLVGLVTESGFGELEVVLGMVLIYLVLGMFLEPIGIMLLTLPIFLPIYETLGTDLIWIGVLVVKLVEIGCLTPPVGLNAFVIQGVLGDRVPITTVFRGLVWFVLCDVVVVGILIAFPSLSLWLPALMD